MPPAAASLVQDSSDSEPGSSRRRRVEEGIVSAAPPPLEVTVQVLIRKERAKGMEVCVVGGQLLSLGEPP